MRLSAAFAILLAIVVLTMSSCVPIRTTDNISAASTDIMTEVVTDKTVYAPGEPVIVNVTATNTGSEQVTLAFPSSLQHYYAVTDLYGYEIFDLRHHVFTQPWLTYLTLDPGASDSAVFSEDLSWKQVDDSGTLVPIPAYHVVWGLLDTEDDYVIGSKTIVISEDATQPTASFNVSSQSGLVGEDFTFIASSSLNTIGQTDLLEYRWDWTGDDTFDTDWTTDPVAVHSYSDPGDYTVILNIRDPAGLESNASTTVTVIEAVPEFSSIVLPLMGAVVLVLICTRKRRRI
jgi:PKD repeat protein